MLWVTFILFFIFTNSFISNSLLKAWEIKPIPYSEMNQEYKYGVVLSGVLDNVQEPRDRPHFGKGADRVFHTLQLYNKGIIKKILVSGGSGRLVEVDYSEAEILKDVFIEMGVPENDILIEGESRNTAESAIHIAAFLNEKDAVNDFILITSAFHMRRARDSFAHFTRSEVPVFPVDLYTVQEMSADALFIPSLDGIDRWQRLIHEIVGYIAYDIVDYI